MRTIAIVGGGFSGTVLATMLLRHPPPTPTRLVLIERGPRVGRGVAFAVRDFPYLLNVPVGRMSANPADPLEFPDYSAKLASAESKTGRHDSIVRGRANLLGNRVATAVSDFAFMGGSMGSVAGEKITRTLELAADESMPAIIFTATGGARMQEGLFSLMQMAKTAAACEKLSKIAPFICIFTDPTMAGVLASYASLADIILAEPGALVGFAGARVAAQASGGGKAPDNYQSAEYHWEHGMIDKVVRRKEMRATLIKIIGHLRRAPNG